MTAPDHMLKNVKNQLALTEASTHAMTPAQREEHRRKEARQTIRALVEGKHY